MKKITLLLVTVALLVGCRTAYEKVNQDAYRTKTERDLLARPCADEFPPIYGVPIIDSSRVDSSDYFKALDAYYGALDANIALHDSILTLLQRLKPGDDPEYLTQEQIIAGILKQTRQADSLRIIRNFIKGYKPVPIIKHHDKLIPTLDSAVMNQRQRAIDECRAQGDKREKELAEAKKYEKRFWIAVSAGVLFIVLLILYLIRQMRKGAVQAFKP